MRVSVVAALLLLVFGPAVAQPLAGRTLMEALRGGGYVLVVRHAASPQTAPAPAEAEADNSGRERQLDDAGKRTAAAMGQAIRRQRLKVGGVWSSPAYRARQTVRLAELPSSTIAPELGDGGHSMQAIGGDQAAGLRALVLRAPAAGTINVIVTHLPNISAAYGAEAAGVADGEALVFRQGEASPVARIKPDEWFALADEKSGAHQ